MLVRAIFENKVKEVERVLNGGNIDINEELWGETTALHLAVKQGHGEIVRLLLERGADLNIKDKYGITPLHYAVRCGHGNIVRLLLERGVDINIKDEYGSTPLHWAAWWGHENIARLLRERGADINMKDKAGRTPLHCAVKEGHENIVRLLLERGADPNIKDEEGETPCNLAEKEGFQNIQDLCQRLISTPVQAYLLREMIIYLTTELVPIQDVRRLARWRLGIVDAMLENLDHDIPRNAREQAYQIMLLWMKRTAGATVYDLFKALKDHQLNYALGQILCKFQDRVTDILNMSDEEFKEWLQPTMTPTNGVDQSKLRLMNLRCIVSDDMKYLYVLLENFNANADKSNINTTRGVIKYCYFGKGIIGKNV